MRRFLLLATCLAVAACGSPTSPRPYRSVAGIWVGETKGYRVRLNATVTADSSVFHGFYPLSGTGTLVTIASGDSLTFWISGTDAPLFLYMQAGAPSPYSGGDVYGRISGTIDDNGALVGTLDSYLQGIVGPLANSPLSPFPITLHRQ